MEDPTDKLVVTVTPNPSVDVLFAAGRLVWEDANRLPQPRRRPGGQGINVSRALAALGGRTLALTLLGGRVGREVREWLAQEHIPFRAVAISNETRVFVAARESETGRSLLLNSRGPQCAAEDQDALLQLVRDALETDRPAWVACCGSLPPGFSEFFYADVGKVVRAAGCRFVPDCDGTPLERAATGCDLLVPNRHEAERLLGVPVTAADASAAARCLRDRFGTSLAVITLGEEGAVVASSRGVWRARPPAVVGGSAVGAGDAFLAAFLVGLEQQPEEEALRRAVAAGTAVLLSQGSALVSTADHEAILGRTRIDTAS